MSQGRTASPNVIRYPLDQVWDLPMHSKHPRIILTVTAFVVVLAGGGVQRGGHVDRAVVIVGALEADVLGSRVGADTREEVRETRPTPLCLVPISD